MKKELLSEVNRTREIMGLGQLIREEAKDPYERVKKINRSTNLTSLLKKTKLPESFQNLTNLAKVVGTNPFGNKNKFAFIFQVLAEHYGNGDWERGYSIITSEKRDAEFVEYITPVQVYSNPDGGGVATHGALNDAGTKLSRGTNNATDLWKVLRYINTYNTSSFASGKGERQQWILGELIEGDNFINFDLGTSPDDTLYVYSTKKALLQSLKRDEDKEPDEEGYKVDGLYDQEYEFGKHTPTNNDEIEKAITEIGQIFTPERLKNISTFTVTSSASDEWGKDENGDPIHHGPSEGTGDPGVGTDNKTKNEYLAYQRGKYFLDQVNEGLKAKGHPGLPTATINWKVQEGGEEKRFIDINLGAYKEDVIGDLIVDDVWVQSEKTEKQQGTVYQYEIALDINKKKGFLGIGAKTYS